MDKKLRELKRLADTGDLDAQRAYDIAYLKVCKHSSGTYIGAIGSMWGKHATWCSDCGKCMSDPELEPRPEGARRHREMEKSFKAAAERLDNMTPEEKKKWNEDLKKALREARKDNTWNVPVHRSTWHKRLD